MWFYYTTQSMKPPPCCSTQRFLNLITRKIANLHFKSASPPHIRALVEETSSTVKAHSCPPTLMTGHQEQFGFQQGSGFKALLPHPHAAEDFPWPKFTRFRGR